MLGRTRRIHFVGIGGSGMNGIAELLANLGYSVSGSDAKRSAVTERLVSLGVRVHEGHDAAHVGDADVLVYSSAIRPTNPEIVEATRRRIPVIPRAEMLAELMRLRYGIAVAGAHGKTTTTSMIALVLERAGLDPTAVIGGRLSAFGSSARLGRGDFMVAEADESDRSFLKLTPAVAVITNIDEEHLESYRDFEDLQQAFVAFANRVPFYGTVVACADDEHLRPLLSAMSRRVVTYGLDTAAADYRGTDVQGEGFDWRCTIWQRRGAEPTAEGARLGEIRLHVPGRHNLQNALAAVAVGMELDVPFERIAGALEEFRGAERRFESHGEAGGVLVIEDYGHHPTEIAAVLAAARAALRRRLLVVFQPHRFTRTKALMDRFGPALRDADEIVLTDIYSAGEEPLPGITIEALAEQVRRDVHAPVHLVRQLGDVPEAVTALARPGDAVITLGAGSIGPASLAIAEALRQRGGAVRTGEETKRP
ncbi:MAG: UDP-N-acetylmuramate--L-alanine ligase [Acidobacteria bacterium]|nr:MAG: UDP-N-acetylmuramate--L-alanine ligase [Acidobacteriota bacterium]